MIPPQRSRSWAWPVAVAVGLLLTLGIPSAATAASVPPIPITQDFGFLSGLSAPVLAPGGQGILSFQLGDPLAQPLTDVRLTMDLYQFSPAPGGTSGAVPSGAMLLQTTNGSGGSVTLQYAAIASGAGVAGSVGVAAGGGAAEGGYSVRTMLTFAENGSPYRFESRGYFSDAAWNAATLPGGTNTPPELNLSQLGVDGITPETAVGVHTDPWLVPIVVIAGIGILVAGVGGIYYFRWGPGSRSGAVRAEDPQSAPSALGK